MTIWTEAAKAVRGFIAAGIFNQDGMIVDGFTADESFHLEHAAAAFVTLLGEADMAGELIDLGIASEVQITYRQSVILLRSIAGSEAGMVLGMAYYALRDRL